MDLISLLRPEILVPILVYTLMRLVPKSVQAKAWYARLQPILPLVLGAGFVWLPFPAVAGLQLEWPMRIAVGAGLGAISASVVKAFRQGVLGQDARIETPTEEPADPQ